MAAENMTKEAVMPVLLKDDTDMPELFTLADTASAQAQTRFFRLLGSELILLGLGTAVGLLSSIWPFAYPITPITLAGFMLRSISVTQLVAGVFILVALVLRLIRILRHYDTKWYGARAVAESVKSVAWRYAVGGRPFELSKPRDIARNLAIQRIEATLTDIDKKSPRIKFNLDRQITEGMARLRDQPLAIRRGAYRWGRIVDQHDWYDGKQKKNRDNAVRANAVLGILEAVGVGFTVLQGLNIVHLNVQAFLTMLASGGIAWVQAQRYQDLSASYRVAAREAADLDRAVQAQEDEGRSNEDEWAVFVDSAEAAFSREHQLWRATRDDPQ